MRPPSPSDWINSLEEWQTGVVGVGLFNGVINDVDCPVVFIDDTKLHIASKNYTSDIWHFNRVTGVFETVPRGSAAWSSTIIEAANLELEEGEAVRFESIDENDVDFKLIRATP